MITDGEKLDLGVRACDAPGFSTQSIRPWGKKTGGEREREKGSHWEANYKVILRPKPTSRFGTRFSVVFTPTPNHGEESAVQNGRWDVGGLHLVQKKPRPLALGQVLTLRCSLDTLVMDRGFHGDVSTYPFQFKNLNKEEDLEKVSLVGDGRWTRRKGGRGGKWGHLQEMVNEVK